MNQTAERWEKEVARLAVLRLAREARAEDLSEIVIPDGLRTRVEGLLKSERERLARQKIHRRAAVILIAALLAALTACMSIPAVREKLGEQVFPEGTDHGADLAGIDHIPIHVGSGIIEILVHLLPALRTSQAVPVFNLLFHDVSAVFRDVGLDQEDILTHVYAVNDGLLTGILADNILIKKRKGAFVRRGCQTDDECIEILQHLIPDIVNGPVALVDYDAVKKLRRILFVIDDLF